MKRDCLAHTLSYAERKHFEEQGFLVVKNALSAPVLEHLTAAVDCLHQEALEEGQATPGELWSTTSFFDRDQAFLDLLDWPLVLPKVWGILGWNIFLYHAHVTIKPPEPNTGSGAGWLEWHQDSGRGNVELRTFPAPRLSLKVGYFLTDVSEPGRGNFYVIPGSHLVDEVPLSSEVGRDPKEATATSLPEAAVPICVDAGAAVIFDRRLWHSRSANHSTLTRKVLFYGYGYRWIRPKDDMMVEHLYEHLSPIRRQLLGDAVKNNGRYAPTEEDVPLKGWLDEHLGTAAVAAMDRMD